MPNWKIATFQVMPKKTKTPTEVTNPELDQGLAKEIDKVEGTKFKSLVDQIEAEYQLSWWYMKPKLDEWTLRLKLYNNQKRDKTAIGDPLLFTVHQTVLASLYDDRLGVDFLGREEGDDEVAENLNSMANFDYDDMEKDILDYEWDWDASFFGRGLMLMMEFSREAKLPMPEVIDMMTWLRDPRAKSVNGDRRGRGAMKFGGREIRLSKQDMKDAGVYFNFEGLKMDNTDIRSLIDQNAQARAKAQGLGDVSKWTKLVGNNGDQRLLEWFTIWQGKKMLVTLADDRTKVVRTTDIKKDYWPILDRAFYPIAHDWDGVSVPDLVEDKQRARSVVQNLSLAGIKLGLEPTYIYDTNKVKNRASLNQEFNKHIGIDGSVDGAIKNVERQTVKSEVNWILEVLDIASQKATATPDLQQGMASEEKRTASEINLVASKVDTRYSLSAKIFGWSEKRFWGQWYQLYKTHFEKDIDEKVIRIVGAMGAKWRTLTRENIIAKTDPDIKIESRVVSEAKSLNDLQKYRLFLKDILATDPQSANVRFALRKIGRLSGFTKDEIEQVLPPTVDELNAENENEKLDAGEMVNVVVSDDDFVHFEVHNRAKDSAVKTAHINAHKKAMILKRERPEFDMARGARPEQNEAAINSPAQFAGGNNAMGGAPKPTL